MDEIRNQLKNQNFGAVLPSSFKQVGSAVFPDRPSIDDQRTLEQIINTWSAIHVPAFGNPIGSSSATVNATGAGGEAEVDVLTAVKSEVYKIQAISIANAGGAAPVICKILLGDVALVMDLTGAPSTQTPFPISNAIYVDANSPLKFAVLSGTASDAVLNVNYIATSQ